MGQNVIVELVGVNPFLGTREVNVSAVYCVSGKVWAFVIVHHEIVQEQDQIEAFSEGWLARHELMDGAQVKVESKRVHVNQLLNL